MSSCVWMHCDALSGVAGLYRVHWDMDFEIYNDEYEQVVSHGCEAELRSRPI